MKPGPRLGYRPALDGLRAISILAVMGYHSAYVVRHIPGGHAGVDIFFVLSGFLITTLLLEEWERSARIDLRAFYLRRVFRLVPALLAFLAALWVSIFLFGGRFKTDVHLMSVATVSILLYVSNWVMIFGRAWPAPLDHLWTLSIEEQFYIVWPFVLFWLLHRNSRKGMIVGLLSIAIVSVVCERALLWFTTHSFTRCYFASDTRGDGIIVGCLVAVMYSNGWWKRIPVLSIIAAAYIIFFFYSGGSDGYLFDGGYTILALAAGVIVVELLEKPCIVLTAPPLPWIGRLSYSLYLWHVPVFYIVERTSLRSHAILGLLVELAAAFFCATASYALIEKPILRLRRSAGTARPLDVAYITSSQIDAAP